MLEPALMGEQGHSLAVPTAEPLASLRDITKSFPGILANDTVDFDVYPGEVHALLGENGAGKSTLMKILYGFYQQDSGKIRISGKEVSIDSCEDARQLQIGMVFQNLTVIPAMPVVENIALFLSDLGPIFNTKQIAERIKTSSERYGLEVDPWAPMWQLSIGQQQKVEILKLLMANARILILDEPTKVLAPHEIRALFSIFKQLKQDDYAIVFITHKLKEVLSAADRITVMRHGQIAGTMMRSSASETGLVAMMFDSVPPEEPRARREAALLRDIPVLELKEISTVAEGFGTSLNNLSLRINPGEIVGVAGVSGNGQRELGDVISGLKQPVSGSIRFVGEDIAGWSARLLRQSGLAFIPENPLTMATIPPMSVLENMALGDPLKYELRGGLGVNWSEVNSDLNNSFEILGLDPPDPNQQVRTLSGGNVQRLILARELGRNPVLIVGLYPTRGLDVLSVRAAQELLISERDKGKGVLLVSEDLGELFALSDRLIVMRDGQLVGNFRPSEITPEEIGHLMTGSD